MQKFYEGVKKGRGAQVFGRCVLVMIVLFSVGCSRVSTPPALDATVVVRAPLPVLPPVQAFTHVLETSYVTADVLAQALFQRDFLFEYPIVAASFVNIDQLMQSSTLGRLIPEYVGSRMAQYGFNIIEIKLRQDSVFIKKDSGEFVLTRDLRHLNPLQDLHAVLVGTYAVSDQFVFVSARIVRVQDNMLIAGHDYEIPLDSVVRTLLK